jgi:selenocysteine lyase/cysteine desulfurase
MLKIAALQSSAPTLDEIRAREFSRLNAGGQTYVDYTGSALYGESQLRAHFELLRRGLFGNPHSEHRPSADSSRAIEEARQLVLRFLGGDPAIHDVVFTANATAAIRLVAESYRFGPEASCVLSTDNHNSVNGIREYARRAGARVRYVPLDEELRLAGAEAVLSEEPGGLLAYPAQSNFSGALHPLPLASKAKARGFDVLLDIASFAGSHAFSLRDCPADFVALSFYKLFGYPTGLGALVARHDALARLDRPWFAGGTVRFASVQANRHALRAGHEAFEDGTADFLGITALPAGFALLEEVQMPRLTAHVLDLASLFQRRLAALHHPNGTPLARVYGPRSLAERGGPVAFNILDAAQTIVPYWQVEAEASSAGIALRGGCFCNPGAAEAALGLDVASTARCLDALGERFTPQRFAECSGTAVGALRVSFGLANDEDDVDKVISHLTRWLTSRQ